ncbi:MAG: hypothetical protein J0L57_01850 [Burkholderiales bacterium]|nr:hypothetical protein [Burkholderiales bacterium]
MGFAPAVIACVDIGSPKKGNVGWAVLHADSQRTGHDLDEFIDVVGVHMQAERPMAVGFECPLYVPKRDDLLAMTDGRLGEEGLNWCGGPGASVLATGLAQVNWVLTRLAAAKPSAVGTTRWREFSSGRCCLFFWEAFITSRAGVSIPIEAVAGASHHVEDALCGALAFRQVAATDDEFPSDLGDERALSLIGMHLLETGLSKDMSLMSEPCAVLKVRKPR